MSEEKPLLNGTEIEQRPETDVFSTSNSITDGVSSQEIDPLQALMDGGCSLEEAQRLLQQFPDRAELQQAIAEIQSRGGSMAPDNPALAHLFSAAEIAYEPPSWLIEPYFQRGACTLVQGEPGIGKTSFLCSIAACVSGNTSLGDGVIEFPVETKGNTLLLSVEDEPSLLKGRYDAASGIQDKLYFLDDAYLLSIADSDGLERLENAVKAIDARFLVLDPIQAFFGEKVDFHRANQTRPVMARLSEMAKRTDCAVALVAHVSKGSRENSPVLRSLGSADIPAACRSVFHVMPKDSESGEICAVHVKSNSAPKGKTIVYTIGERGEAVWRGFTDDTVANMESPVRDAPEKTECKEFILEAISDGDVKSAELDKLMKNAGFSRSTANRAKAELKEDGQIFYSPVYEDNKKVYYTSAHPRSR